MQPLEKAEAPEGNKTEDTVWRIGEDMRRLAPGDLARLRRTADDPLRAPHYWRWKARFHWPRSQDDAWAAIIAIMAILTPKGRDDEKRSPHDRNKRLGAVLCNGGDLSWGKDKQKSPRPKVSELRLTKLLNTTGAARRVALLRAVRAISSGATGVNCVDVANFLLRNREDRPTQRIAQAYYARWDHAEHQFAKTEGKEDQ